MTKAHPIPAPHFALIAGELSGDILGAALVRGLLARFPNARFSGVCGPRMLEAGVTAVASIDSLSLMGLAEVLPALPRLFAFRGRLLAHWEQDRPTAVIGIDAPDFNLGLERRLKARGIPTVHVVSPSIWAWRAGRIHGIRRAVDLMLCLFPFEPAIYHAHGMQAECIGHPLADQLAEPATPQAGREALGLPQAPTLAILPGSRSGEVTRLAPVFAQAAAQLAARVPGLQCITPVAKPSVGQAIANAKSTFAPKLPWTVLEGQSHAAMRAADVVLVASGTATLEALLVRRPMVVGYQTSAVTAAIVRRLIKVQQVSLPNLLCAASLVRELLQEDCTPEALASALYPLFTDASARAQQIDAFGAVHDSLRRDAGRLAAEAIATMLGSR